jgi:hypothetical protein
VNRLRSAGGREGGTFGRPAVDGCGWYGIQDMAVLTTWFV